MAEDLTVTVPEGSAVNLTSDLVINSEIQAPLREGQELGTLSVVLGGEEILSVPLVALNPVERASVIKRFWDSIQLFFIKLFGGDPLRAD